MDLCETCATVLLQIVHISLPLLGLLEMSLYLDMKLMYQIEKIKRIANTKFKIVTMNDMCMALREKFDRSKLGLIFNLVELRTTIKPFAFQYSFQKLGVDSAIYRDNDIWVISSLETLNNESLTRSTIVTPHSTSIIPGGS